MEEESAETMKEKLVINNDFNNSGDRLLSEESERSQLQRESTASVSGPAGGFVPLWVKRTVSTNKRNHNPLGN